MLRELAAEGVVGGVKESADEVGRFLQILNACPPPFAAFCGTPPLLIPAVLAGGHGGILAIANAVPERCAPSTRRPRRAMASARRSCSLPSCP